MGLKIEPVKVDEKFKDDALLAFESFIDISTEAMPFGSNIAKSFSRVGLKWIKKYFDEIGALPLLLQYCKGCDAVISSELLINPMPRQGQS
jgi:hypothetical protein